MPARPRDTRHEIVNPFLRFYLRFIDRFRERSSAAAAESPHRHPP
jgi:hypothetical protein